MSIAGRALASIAAIAMVTGAAAGAEAQVSQAPIAYMPEPVFDWTGLHFGVYQSAIFAPSATGAIARGGVQGGYNFVSGRFLAGAEVQISALVAGANAAEVALNARGGLLVGPRTLLYAEIGVAWWFLIAGSALTQWYGGGAEFAVNDRLTVSAEFKVGNLLGTNVFSTQLGINWYP